jgi:flagellar protein FliL
VDLGISFESSLLASRAMARDARNGTTGVALHEPALFNYSERRQTMAQDDVEATEQPQPAKRKKLPLIKMIILPVLVALLGGGGYLGYAKFIKPPPEESKQPEVEQNVAHEMGTFLVNLSDPGGKRYLKISIQLELNSQVVSQELNKRNVEVRDAILMILSSKEYNDIGNAMGKMVLKREILTRLNKMLRDGQAREIYFTEFLVQ